LGKSKIIYFMIIYHVRFNVVFFLVHETIFDGANKLSRPFHAYECELKCRIINKRESLSGVR